MSNCCLPAFFCEVLVNYVSDMIRIKLNSCSILWKQREFLHGLTNLQSSFLSGQYTGSSLVVMITYIFRVQLESLDQRR